MRSMFAVMALLAFPVLANADRPQRSKDTADAKSYLEAVALTRQEVAAAEKQLKQAKAAERARIQGLKAMKKEELRAVRSRPGIGRREKKVLISFIRQDYRSQIREEKLRFKAETESLRKTVRSGRAALAQERMWLGGGCDGTAWRPFQFRGVGWTSCPLDTPAWWHAVYGRP
ncbi:MAG: hypothetical protein HY924_13590 [Elusimicrobia bacterium]|nr:hypothetical protein [Elusimicrobiota bacterium]